MVIVYAAINMPFVMWTMLSFYEGIPTTLDEAAFVDGASSLQTFSKVILPICRPGLATAFIFTLFLAADQHKCKDIHSGPGRIPVSLQPGSGTHVRGRVFI